MHVVQLFNHPVTLVLILYTYRLPCLPKRLKTVSTSFGVEAEVDD